ncbi:MAG: binding-protein-dependent transport system inner rane component [Solirubrobacterales bacterium]|nr:binding-protein-dependent transport system inner rane component [Solirubrobacterales bacterium]
MSPLLLGDTVIPDFGSGSACERDNGWLCTGWLHAHWGDTLQPALVQHVELSLIAVGIGFVLAAALTLLGLRIRALDPPIGLFADFLYTIPSLALFQLLVPVTGLTVTTVEIALVSYTLLILYRNMIAGLRAVPAETLEAARGTGLTRTQIFLRVEVPLALPTIVAGLRIATVSTVSIATVAAFVIPRGLGHPIFIALNQDIFKTEILAAGGLVIALALFADLLLVLGQRVLTPWTRAA